MPCLQPVVGCWWCEFSLSSRQRQGANLIFMRALYRDRYVHTYMVCTFYTNLWLVLHMQKTTTKPCVCQVKCPPFFLVKRTNAQVPFFSLGKNIRFRQANFCWCPPGCTNRTANLWSLRHPRGAAGCVWGQRLVVFGSPMLCLLDAWHKEGHKTEFEGSLLAESWYDMISGAHFEIHCKDDIFMSWKITVIIG